MPIQRFYAPESEMQDVGLGEIKMDRLGRFVVLAGSNGAGKSRLLSKLEFYANAYSGVRLELGRHQADVTRYETILRQSNLGESEIEYNKSNLRFSQSQVDMVLNRVCITGSPEKNISCLRFVPKNLNLYDPFDLRQSELIANYSNVLNGHTHDLNKVCVSYIQHVQNRWWSTTNPNYTGSVESVNVAKLEFEKLNGLVQQFLGINLDRDIDDKATVFDKPIAKAQLSEGQQIILQLCTLLHSRKSEIKNTIFLLDEPENHLHPSIVIEIIENLVKNTLDCQFWIATHSIPLIAFVASIEPMAIWYMDIGKVSNAGRSPESVLEGLLGNEQQIGHLRDFTLLPAQLAETNFAAQSLLPPTVVGQGENDSQVLQIAKLLREKVVGRPLAVLDYGAGKGRLLDGMAAFSAESGTQISDWINYFAFDEYKTDQEICEGVIKANYSETESKRYFNRADDFHAVKDNGSIDVVVMCNVLHEITPNAWLNIFAAQHSLIMRALSDSGYLLIVEDQRIPVGEKAHEYGFLVLDTPHLKTLFCITEQDIQNKLFLVNDARGNQRLKAHLIAKPLLTRMSSATRTDAIKEMKSTAIEEIRRLREQAPDYKTGQLHGFWLQQLANAQLYLDEAIGGS